MKKSESGGLDINWERVKKELGQLLSPTFLVILLATFLIWFASQLRQDYTTEMPLNIRIDDQKYRLTAIVSGRGSTILAERLSLRKPLVFTAAELTDITPEELINALNVELKERLHISRIIEAPGVVSLPE